MAFNGSGTYTLPGAALATGATVSSTENNTFRNDVATAFNKTSTRDGQTVPTANLPMGGFKLTGLGAATTNGDAVRFEQITTAASLGLVIGTNVQAYDAATAKTNIVQSFSVAQRGTITALTDGATITPDFAAANNYSVTLGGNRTLANPSNLTAGQSGVIVITQDGTGSRTLAYGSYWKFSNGTAPTLTTTASAVDVLAYYVESPTRITAKLVTDVK